jgi:hypothetical protein
MLRNRRQECHRAYRRDAQFLIEYLATRLTRPRLVVFGLANHVRVTGWILWANAHEGIASRFFRQSRSDN